MLYRCRERQNQLVSRYQSLQKRINHMRAQKIGQHAAEQIQVWKAMLIHKFLIFIFSHQGPWKYECWSLPTFHRECKKNFALKKRKAYIIHIKF